MSPIERDIYPILYTKKGLPIISTSLLIAFIFFNFLIFSLSVQKAANQFMSHPYKLNTELATTPALYYQPMKLQL